MKLLHLYIASLLLLAAQVAIAATFENDVVSIEVPNGFQGPVSEPSGAEAVVIGFKKSHPNGSTNTLLQITVYNFGAHMPAIPKARLGEAADNYLAQFLKGVERRRTSFSATASTRISLGGLPAARVSWSGITEGRAMRGVMYCSIVGSKVISFHTQDFKDAPPANLQQAVTAIESVRFKRGG